MTSKEIENFIASLIDLPENTLKLKDEVAFDLPIVGYASGEDLMFGVKEYENHIPGLHPAEWLDAKYGHSYKPSRISVISWALPIPQSVREKMRAEQYYPCMEWSLNANYGQAFIRQMATRLEDFFEEHGIDAISPIADDRVRRMRAEHGLSTNWSESMAAYICGLGTIRKPYGVITEIGSCVQLGSIIVATKLPPSVRKYTRLNEYCANCGACAKRCPVGAVKGDDVDRRLCRMYQTLIVLPHVKDKFGFDGVYDCGLCKTDVPCESCRPILAMPEHTCKTDVTETG